MNAGQSVKGCCMRKYNAPPPIMQRTDMIRTTLIFINYSFCYALGINFSPVFADIAIMDTMEMTSIKDAIVPNSGTG